MAGNNSRLALHHDTIALWYTKSMRASYWLFAATVGIALLASGVYIFSLWRLSPSEIHKPIVSPPPVLSDAEILTQGEWQLIEVVENGSSTFFAEPRTKIAFTPRRIAGEFCNIFTGLISIGPASLTVSKVESTVRVCENGALMAAEGLFNEGAVLPYVLENGMTLTIVTPTIRLIFEHGE